MDLNIDMELLTDIIEIWSSAILYKNYRLLIPKIQYNTIKELFQEIELKIAIKKLKINQGSFNLYCHDWKLQKTSKHIVSLVWN